MESKAADHSTPDVFAGEGVPAKDNRQLRASLQSVFLDPALRQADAPSADRRKLRIALRGVCAEARGSGLRAEQLLVIIKDVWSALPAGISHAPSVHGDERLNYVVTTCVDEYYGHVDGEREASL
jgi:hypothetical protein